MTPTTPIRPRIVVGIDGSSESKSALIWASRLADATHSTIEAYMVWHYPGFGWLAPGQVWDPRLEADKVINTTVDEVFGAHRPSDLKIFVREGNPARVLLDAAKGAQMVVVGSRGHGGFSGLTLGSVSAAVAEHATCPVLVIHGESAVSGVDASLATAVAS